MPDTIGMATKWWSILKWRESLNFMIDNLAKYDGGIIYGEEQVELSAGIFASSY
jgi:hypothetical protein